MTISAYFFRPSTDPQFLVKASLSFFLGGLALGGALWLYKETLQTLVPSQIAVSSGHTRWWMVGVGVALLALLAETSGQRFHLPALANMSVHIQFGLLALGIMLIGWGLAGEVQWKCFTTERQNGLLLCAITLIGLVVRTWGLDLTARFMQD